MRGRLVLAVAALALGVAVGVPQASASTLTIHAYDADLREMVYVGAPGEENELDVHVEEGLVVLTDPGAIIEPNHGCDPSGTHTVTCDIPRLGWLVAELGDEGDTAIADGGDVTFDGGAGDDALDLGGGRGALVGGSGTDTLTGGDGEDLLSGGADADFIDGGAGRDRVSYEGHAAPVYVDLRAPSIGGANGEGDTIANMEYATGGSGGDTLITGRGRGDLDGGDGDDVLRGGAAADHIEGNAGDDTIGGAGGRDEITGGAGKDTIRGGRGDDLLKGHEWDDSGFPEEGQRDERDSIRCGPGADRVEPGYPYGWGPTQDVLELDCERLGNGWLFSNVQQLPRRNPVLTLRLSAICVVNERCPVRVTLRTDGRVVGRKLKKFVGSTPQKIRTPLSPYARDLLAQTGSVRLRVSLVIRSEGAPPDRRGWYVLLRLPP